MWLQAALIFTTKRTKNTKKSILYFLSFYVLRELRALRGEKDAGYISTYFSQVIHP